MNEHHVVEQLLAYVNGNLDDASSRMVRDHLASCAECRREYDAVNRLWEELGRSPEELPGPSLERGFQSMLSAYEQGMRHMEPKAPQAGARAPHVQKERLLDRLLERLLAGRPAFQVGLALCMLAVGLVAGYLLTSDSRNAQEMAQLRQEVQGLSNLLAVSLLQQESASERLKGVSWSGKFVGSNPEINSALVNAMKHDRNVNVRLAALDALSRDLDSPAVRHEIIHTLPNQRSPLMQIALVDLLVQLNDNESRDVLQQALNKPDLNPDVRKRIMQGIQQLL